MKRPRILILIDWAWPAYKAGGPVKSIENLVQLFGQRFDFYILTGDRDLGDERPFTDMVLDQWLENKNHFIRYVSEEEQTILVLQSIIADIKPDILYVNGVFSRFFSFYPVLLSAFSQLSTTRLLIAPRGMLAHGAMNKKKWRKKLYLSIYRRLSRMGMKVYWHAMDSGESRDIRSAIRCAPSEITAASNIPDVPLEKSSYIEKNKELRLLTISRLAKEKNIDGLVNWISSFTGVVQLDIFGWFEDDRYEQEVFRHLNNVRPNVRISFCGELRPDEVSNVVQGYHGFISLTHGENFGHSIFEAMAVGRPVIISPHTPWTDIEKENGGFVVGSERELHDALQTFSEMDQTSWEEMCCQSLSYARMKYDLMEFENSYKQLFST